MEIDLAELSLNSPWVIGAGIVIILAIIAGLLWWLHKEGKIKLPFIK
jgi:hypothetical protein